MDNNHASFATVREVPAWEAVRHYFGNVDQKKVTITELLPAVAGPMQVGSRGFRIADRFLTRVFKRQTSVRPSFGASRRSLKTTCIHHTFLKNYQYVWWIQVVFSDLREAPNEGLALV